MVTLQIHSMKVLLNSRYENREREADYETLIKFADYFNVSLDYLLGRTDDENN